MCHDTHKRDDFSLRSVRSMSEPDQRFSEKNKKQRSLKAEGEAAADTSKTPKREQLENASGEFAKNRLTSPHPTCERQGAADVCTLALFEKSPWGASMPIPVQCPGQRNTELYSEQVT